MLLNASALLGSRRPPSCQSQSQRASPLPPGRQRYSACHAAKKNNGGASSSSGDGEPASDTHRLQDAIRDSRQQQLVATDMLAKLLQAEDAQQVASEFTDSLDEQFFWTTNTYLAMAKKEKNEDVVGRLEHVLKAAFEAKQATLRPEIQLLNRLLSQEVETEEQRQQLLSTSEAAATLAMNDRYFFQLLGRMQRDVERQPEGQQRTALLSKLESIMQVAEGIAPQQAGSPTA